MPFPIAPALIAGAALAGTGASIAATGNANKKNRAFQKQMYEQQYRDSIDFWDMQNAYNTPEQQMQRFKEAGLNPNLIYGQGNSGNASPANVPDVQRYDHKIPDFSGIAAAGSGLASHIDYQIKSAQLQNLEADRLNKLEEALLKQAQRDNLGASTARSKFDLDFDTELRATSADLRIQTLNKVKQDLDLSLRADERAAAQNSASLRESAEKILTMRLQRAQTQEEIKRIKAVTKDTQLAAKLKEFQIELNKYGVTQSDPIYWRVLAQILEGYTVSNHAKTKSNFFLKSNPQYQNR